jgi:dTDP-4-dehydrorhamnose 3,5-epimerase
MTADIQPEIPHLIPGALYVDDRGSLACVNDFAFVGVRRAYLTQNHRPGFIRAWHGHRKERKWVIAVGGAALVCAVKVDDWDKPGTTADCWPTRFVLSASQPAILAIPSGYANGWKSLTPDCRLMWFSSATVEESRGDDQRFPARLWDCWGVEER